MDFCDQNRKKTVDGEFRAQFFWGNGGKKVKKKPGAHCKFCEGKKSARKQIFFWNAPKKCARGLEKISRRGESPIALPYSTPL